MSSTTTPIRAGTPLLDQGIRAVNFFNGRLLTSRDLGREQDARREAGARLGQAIGAGIVEGLEVSRQGEPLERRLSIKKGLAVSRAGQTLCLGADQVLALVPEGDVAPPATSGGFGPCGILSGGTYVAGDGIYLLTLAPAMAPEGKAEVLALEPGNVRCNTDATVEAVQFRLLRIEPELLSAYGIDSNATAPPAVSRLRNALAYACFGYPALADAHRQSGVAPGASLLDAMRLRALDDCDVPLAVVYLNADGLIFVDRCAVRRRVASRAAAPSWTAWLGEPLDALGEAQLTQFQEHLADIPSASLSGLSAAAWFGWLPPAGFLDAEGPRAVGWEAFLGARKPARFVPLAPGDARAMLSLALARDAVPLASGATRFRVYRITGGPWLFVREAPNAPHAEEVWLDGTRARLPGVDNVQAAIDALRARSCGQLGLWPGADVQALVATVPKGSDLSLCIEAGTYSLNEPLTLKDLGHVVIHGTGAGSLLHNKGGEAALLVATCKSLTVCDLAVRADKPGVGKSESGVGLMGALTVVDTPQVHIKRVSAQCGGAKELAAGGIVVTHTKPGQEAKQIFVRRVSVSDCELAVGEGQLGFLCVHCEIATVRRNTVIAAAGTKALQRGIVIAGELAREVRIEDNVLADVAQGIAIGLSRKEETEGKGLRVDRAVLVRNSVRVALSDADLKRNRFGLFVGNAQSLLVAANRVTAEDLRVREVEMEALRLSGDYGRHVVVRDNHSSGTPTGIGFAPQGALPASVEECLWVFEANLAEQAAEVIDCSEPTRRLLREQNNVALS